MARLFIADYAPKLLSSSRPFLFPDGTLSLHLRNFGFLPSKTSLSKSPVPVYSLRDHQFTGLVTRFEKELGFSNVFAGTIGTLSNVSVNMRKLDVVPNFSFRDSSKYDLTIQFCMWFDQIAFSSDMMSMDDVLDGINRKAVAGYPECLQWSNKGECCDSDYFWDLYYSPECDQYPIFKYSPKIEWKSLSEIVSENKIRGFAVGSARATIKQREYFGVVSTKMKMTRWSYHGFNPFAGGTTSLVNYLGWHRQWIRWDVSGWDRLFPLMREVMRLWTSKLRVPSTRIDEFRRLFSSGGKLSLEKFFYLTVDGIVVEMNFSNPSGNGLTTEINISGHKFVLALFFFEHTSWTFQQVAQLIIALYGDDVVMARPLLGEFGHVEFSTLFPVDDVGRVYKPWLKRMFGWDTKFFISDDAPHLTGVVFLGFNPVPLPGYPGHFVPMWNRDRLSSPFYRCIGQRTDAAQLNTMYNLCVMSYADPVLHRNLSSAYLHVLSTLGGSIDPEIKAAVLRGAPHPLQLVNFYTGLEASNIVISEDCLSEFFDNTSWMVGGRNDLVGLQASLFKFDYSMQNVRKEDETGSKNAQSKSNVSSEKDRAIYAKLNGKAQDLLERGKVLLGKAVGDAAKGGKPSAEHAALAKRVGQLAATVKGSAKTVRQSGEGKSSSKGANGVPRLAPGGLKRPLGVGPNTPGVSNAVIPRNGPVPGSRYIHINGVPHLQMVHNGVYRNFKVVPFGQIKMPMRPSFGTKNMPTNVANGTMFFSGGPQFTEKVGKEGHVVRIADTQMVTSLAVDQAIPALGFRLPGFELSPEALGGYLAQFASMYEENALIEAEAVYAPCVGNDNEGALGMSFRNNIGQDGLDIGPDAYNEFVNSPAFAQAPIYEQMSIPIRPSKLAEAYFNSTGGEANDEATETQGEVSFMSGSALAAGQQLGNVFITYVWEFKVPALSSDLFPVGQTVIKMGVNSMSVANSQGTPVYASQLDGDVVPDNFPGWFPVSGPQLDFTNVYEAFISRYTAGEPLPPFYIPDRVLLNGEARFALGQSHYCKFINKNTDGDFTIDNYLYFFESKAAAMSPAFVWELDEGGQNPGQYLYVGTEEGGPEYGGPTCACYLILRPVASQI